MWPLFFADLEFKVPNLVYDRTSVSSLSVIQVSSTNRNGNRNGHGRGLPVVGFPPFGRTTQAGEHNISCGRERESNCGNSLSLKRLRSALQFCSKSFLPHANFGKRSGFYSSTRSFPPDQFLGRGCVLGHVMRPPSLF